MCCFAITNFRAGERICGTALMATGDVENDAARLNEPAAIRDCQAAVRTACPASLEPAAYSQGRHPHRSFALRPSPLRPPMRPRPWRSALMKTHHNFFQFSQRPLLTQNRPPHKPMFVMSEERTFPLQPGSAYPPLYLPNMGSIFLFLPIYSCF